MSCEDNLVELAPGAIGKAQSHAAAIALNRADSCSEMNIRRVRPGERSDVCVAPTAQSLPFRTRIDTQKAVIVEEADEGDRGKVAHLAGRGRPDRRRHRIQIA